MRNRLSNLHAVDLMIVAEIPEVEIVAVDPVGKMVNDEAVDVAANADPAVVVVDAPVIVEVAGGAKAVAEVAADEAVVAEAKPSSLIV